MIDYQNVHLTARDTFDPRGDAHDSLIHPQQFAARAVIERNAVQRAGYEHATLARVVAFRGLPHVDHDWEQHRRCIDQAVQWRSDGARIELRDLKYKFRLGADRRPITDIYGKKEPIGRPVEKGIDVLCALTAVREAAAPDIDLVILATRDTDLVPVLDEIHDLHEMDPERYARIETVSWRNPNAQAEGAYNGGNLRPTGSRRIWNTNLGRDCYDASIDRRDYR
ncbi:MULTISPECIES: hypothetical protein [unclassified Rathayibacter]|uniref:hypothetical protein n=1 Tax=unclassified Rathayibacter TaxID=2609250 RepID=UPI0015E3FC9C|nr:MULTISPECIES: hypothetical protein [unclassified Rathayibacter]